MRRAVVKVDIHNRLEADRNFGGNIHRRGFFFSTDENPFAVLGRDGNDLVFVFVLKCHIGRAVIGEGTEIQL